jgi:hypothetical protein
MTWLGDYPEDFTTVTVMFTTHSATGAPVAPSSAFEIADLKVYKNGSAAEKATTNGMTMASPFDSITGLHCVVIDTSNDTGDGGFWVAGAVYTVVLSPDETVDGVVVLKVIGQFAIMVTAQSVLTPVLSRLPTSLTADGYMKSDALMVNGETPASLEDVNAEMVDVIATDTYGEPPQGSPLATATLAAKVGYLYKSWRNKKEQTSTEFRVFADDGTTVDHKATVSDGSGTVTRGEVSSGP